MPHKELECKSGRILQIFFDQNAESPREWDNRGVMACFHNKYTLGDKVSFSPHDFENWTFMKAYIETVLGAVICLPLSIYDHGSIMIKIGDHRGFDSGRIGFIYLTQNSLDNDYESQGDGDGLLDDESEVSYHNRLTSYLESEVEVYNQYLEGDVYGFKLIERTEHNDADKDVEIDSCWGFYGDNIKENGMLDHISPEDYPLDTL